MEKTRKQRNPGKRSLARFLALLLCIMLPFGVASCSDSGNTTPNTAGAPQLPPTLTPPPPPSLTFLEAQYRASHNSYSGNQKGYRGSIIQQLDAGIRFVEFDIRHSFYLPAGPLWPAVEPAEILFYVGHDSVGDEVDHSNDNPPDTEDLRWWLARVARWVAQYEPSEPVIVALDWKDTWYEDFSPKALEALNNFLVNSEDLVNVSTDLPDYILSPVDFNPSESISEYHGKIMIVLSGNKNVRDHLAENYCFKDEEPKDGQAEVGTESDPPPTAHMFVEYQGDETPPTYDGDQIFYANGASGNCTWAQKKRVAGHFVRLWQVTGDNDCEWESYDAANGEFVTKGPNLPATDFPYFGWYARYMEDLSPIPAFDFQNVSGWNWTPQSPGKGSNPDVAINNLGFVVEVHKSQNGDTLWCKAGKINDSYNPFIDWISNDTKYDKNGQNPSVVLTDTNLVVEVHSNSSGALYYKVGRLNPNDGKISWAQGEDKAEWYDDGKHPWLAINENNTVVEVHEGSNGDLWYNVGTVHNSDSDDVKSMYITWHGTDDGYRKYFDGVGTRPTVAVHGNLVFEAHNAVSDPFDLPTLWCQIGELDSNGRKINWKIPGLPSDSTYAYKTTYPYPIDQSGSLFPTVALNSTGALEAHMSGHDLWWRAGKQSNSVMAVGPSAQIPVYASGTEISIDANETHAVLSFVSGDSDIYYMVGNLE